jgi:uncharacterized membrane protein YedE/YeeE
MKQLAVAFLSGALFAAGLALSGMTDPQRVIGFLDVTGAWDPTLLLVMAGAIGAHTFAARWALGARAPLVAPAFALPTTTRVDASLVAGSALFGLGWGASGFCPGPALVDLAAPTSSVLTFVAAMLAGSFAYQARVLFGDEAAEGHGATAS